MLNIKFFDLNLNILKSTFYISVFLYLIPFSLWAQSGDYWQQEVHYKIDVTLDDDEHRLEAFLELDYINHSPDTLKEVILHLWPNAFSDTKSEFSKQMVENRSTEFYSSLKHQRGAIRDLAFVADQDSLKWKPWNDRVDVAVLPLKYPLLPGDRVLITTPFTVDIPESFSRLGRVGQSYQVTQWYPKPAVYDKDGWHPMSYLNIGEFYAEFGSFDVSITLPKNYVVGATGNLQTESEMEFLNQKSKTGKSSIDDKSNDFPASSEDYKTIRYTQDRVHDFAWFADKRFQVMKEEFTIAASGEKCTAWAMFTNKEAKLWREGALEYLVDGTQFYSARVGAYPYKNVTAVQSALSAGSGMEYPTITVIGEAGNAHLLERVIVHEVGHNWFQGMLATNERDHPWMDEGMNSYYELRYFKEKYGRSDELTGSSLPPFIGSLLGIHEMSDHEVYQLATQAAQRKRLDQPICSHSEHLTMSNYGNMVYGKAAVAFDYLESDLGKKRMDKIMKEYFANWSFKHPQPDDFCMLLENSAAKELSWFCDGIISTTKRVDYKLHKLKQSASKIGDDSFDVLLVRNHPRNLASPFSISAIKDGKIGETVKYDGFKGQTEVLFPSSDYDYLKIDAKKRAPEYDRRNDVIRPRAFFKRWEGFNVSLLPKIERDAVRDLFITPLVGFNYYDKFMLGAAVYNNVFPTRNFEFTIAPMYAFGSGELTGAAEVAYKYYPASGILSSLELRVSGRKFGYAFYRDEANEEVDIQYTRLVPSLKLNLRKSSMRSPISSSIKFRHIFLSSEQPDIAENRIPNNYFESENINELSFKWNNEQTLNPYGIEITGQQSSNFYYASAEATMSIGLGKGRFADLRLFAGSFFDNQTRDNSVNISKRYRQGLTDWGSYDYAHDDIYLGRNHTGFGRRQIYSGAGGFKIPTAIGRTGDWLIAFNLMSDLPFLDSFPLKLFVDAGTTDGETTSIMGVEVEETVSLQYDAGLALSIFSGKVEIYFPLILSSDLLDNYQINNRNFWERISFKIDFADLEPIGLARRIKF